MAYNAYPYWLVAVVPAQRHGETRSGRFIRVQAQNDILAKVDVERELNPTYERVFSVAREEWVLL